MRSPRIGRRQRAGRSTDARTRRSTTRAISEIRASTPTRAGRDRRAPGGGAPSAQLIRELSGEGRAARSNEQFQYLLAHGATGLEVIGDAPTLASMDPDHPFGAHSVGNQGVSLCRAAHWEELYAGLPLDQVSVSHSLPPAFGVAGFYLAAKRLGWDPKLLRGSMINAPLFSEDTCYSHNVPMPRGSRDRLPSAGAELERSA